MSLNYLKKNCIQKIGLVPVIGGLTTGHFKLIQTAQKECDKVYISLNKLTSKNIIKKHGVDLSDLFNRNIEELKMTHINSIFNIPIPKRKINFRYPDIISKYTDYLNEFHVSLYETLEVTEPTHIYFNFAELDECYVLQKIVNSRNHKEHLRLCEPYRYNDNLISSLRNFSLNEIVHNNSEALFETLQKARKFIYNNSNLNILELKYFIMDELRVASNFENVQIDIFDFPSFKEVRNLYRRKPYFIQISAQIGNSEIRDYIIV